MTELKFNGTIAGTAGARVNAQLNQRAKRKMTEAELLTGHSAEELDEIQADLKAQFYARRAAS